MSGKVEQKMIEAIRREHSKLVALEDPMEVTRLAAKLYYGSQKEMEIIRPARSLSLEDGNLSLQARCSVDSTYCKLYRKT